MYGQRIKELRIERGFSQTQLAKELNTTQRTISKYELEQLDLNTPTLIALCKLFNVTADYLLGLTDNY
ncbi:MAG: helix-turn-helix transcriptional regulator [Clostridia bacterium]|nr:helix-turn-helix transcriptional regulator [Clostridia bacterium]MBQ8876459.1 helix-turn-helix transcriptional regulator [Clostridia bacterium]